MELAVRLAGRARALPSARLFGTVRPPGDKSVSHRAILFGAMAEGDTLVEGLLESDDVLRTAAGVRVLGAGVERTGPGRWRVTGVGARGFSEPSDTLDFGNSGTGCRLMMGVVAGYPITVGFTGDESLRARPMERVLEPLRAMGAVARASEGGRLPASVRGRPPLRPTAWISKTASAQVKSAVLLAGLAADGVTEFVEPSQSRDHTERLLRQFGADIDTDTDGSSYWRRITGPALLSGAEVHVPADPSSAAFLAAAAVTAREAEVRLESVMVNPTRTGFYETLFDMGADLDIIETPTIGSEPAATMVARASALKAVEAPAERAASMIDEYPILAVCAAFAEGVTVLRGAAELRVKETDRVEATAEMLRAAGVAVEEFPDGLAVTGRGADGVAGGGRARTRGDHRIAMAALVLGLGAKQPMEIDDAAMIATSYPSFFDDLKTLGARVEAPET
ncbi:MAG: 3-phosphoshikimate 1-carboxyvinyltransferase [Caulobacterales bacterium]|nr:3-phosphoshikimate 1-carboxyvinyltransferase [Caulobacterales bacterium]